MLRCDELAQHYCHQYDIPLTILRPSQLYDAASKCRKHQALFYSIVDRAALGEDITIYGRNDALRNLLYLDDFCQIIVSVIEKELNGIFDCASPDSYRLSDIAELAYRVFARGGKVMFDTNMPDIPDLSLVFNSKLYEKIGLFPETDLPLGIEKIKEQRMAPT